MKRLYTLMFCLIASLSLMAQGSITGTIMDKGTDDPLIGASVFLKGTTKGAITDLDGVFNLTNVKNGTYQLEISYLGYTDMTIPVTVEGDDVNIGTVALESEGIGLQEILVTADIAVDRKTPVAISTLKAEQIEAKIGNQELPELLNVTPSVYATKQGGGYGDANLIIRGFNQRNAAVLINGIPVNDMENGWVYWSNWAGLADVSRTMQVQRGLGASKLAIASVGGTVNIITRTTDQKKGGSAFTTIGNDGFLKAGLTLSTGRMDNGFAVTFSGSRTQGDGYIDATYIDAWSYFLSIAKDLGSNHQLAFTAIGAPQKHGQRTFREDLDTYIDTDKRGGAFTALIKDSKVSDFNNRKTRGDVEYSPAGNIRYNGDWGFRDGEIFNIRENFYHKPQFALNHFWTINDNAFLSTSAYLSFGRGGGTGDRGSINRRGPWGYRDSDRIQRLDDIVAWNTGTDGIDGFPSQGKFLTSEGYVSGERDGIIKRASMNEHNWQGIISKLDLKLSDNLSLITGVDLRGYEGLHYRKVVDLMGTDKWLEPRDVNNQGTVLDINGDGDTRDREEGKFVTTDGKLFGNPGQDGKINYDNDGQVGWQGAFAELEFSKGDFTAFVSGALSNTSYKRIDRFNYEIGSELETSEKYNFGGYNFKTGFNYNINRYMNIFANTGFFSKAPIFDDVFPRFNNVDVNPDAANEKVFGLEFGYGLRTGAVAVNINSYYTEWRDKAFQTSTTVDDQRIFANITGLDAIHRGIEVEFRAAVYEGFSLVGSSSFNNWEWRNNVSANFLNEDNEVIAAGQTVYADGLKVGAAPQTQFYLGGNYDFNFGLSLDLGYKHNSQFYGDFDPLDRTNPTSRGRQALLIPSYGLFDAGLTIRREVSGYPVRFRVNVYNLLDELYVAEAEDAVTLDQAAGFFGFGRTWSAGLKVSF